MVRLPPSCFSASLSVVTAMRVIDCSSGAIGSTERANATCTGPRACPQLISVDMTAPNMRMSKNVWHIHARVLSIRPAFSAPFASALSPSASAHARKPRRPGDSVSGCNVTLIRPAYRSSRNFRTARSPSSFVSSAQAASRFRKSPARALALAPSTALSFVPSPKTN